MKKIITTFALAIIMITGINAQIKKPKAPTNAVKNKTIKIEQGLKVDLNSISVNNLSKLKIPVSTMNKEFLNAKAISSWEITPLKPIYAQLKLFNFYGLYHNNKWTIGDIYTNSPISQDRIDQYVIDFYNRYDDRNSPAQTNRIFPVVLKFRASAGARYILSYDIWNTHPSESVFIGRGPYITEVYFVDGKINYVFEPNKSEEITIYISPKLGKTTDGIRSFRPTSFERGIKIDRIN
ncbi:hypothetical protein [Yeosuana marina]|uniref:hypothetical protein n=1 Tax=Yeosuana marina TaxID=1565536 RepID=UPI0030C8533F